MQLLVPLCSVDCRTRQHFNDTLDQDTPMTKVNVNFTNRANNANTPTNLNSLIDDKFNHAAPLFLRQSFLCLSLLLIRLRLSLLVLKNRYQLLSPRMK